MKEKKQDELWMTVMKDKLSDYSEPLPSFGWEKLEQELGSPPLKKVYPLFRWQMAVAAAVFLAVLSSVTLYFLRTPAADEIRRTSVQATAVLPDKMPDATQPMAPIAKPTPIGKRLNQTVKPQLLAQNDKIDKPLMEGVEQVNEGLEKQLVPSENTLDQSDKNSGEEASKVIQEDEPFVEKRVTRPSSRDKYHQPMTGSTKKRSGWSMGVSVGQANGTSTESRGDMSQSPGFSRLNVFSSPDGLIRVPENQNLIFKDGVPYLTSANEIAHVEHRLPLTFGVSVRKRLGHGLSLESGLTYTYLASDVRLLGVERDLTQKLHYIGLPVRLNWTFVDKKRVSFYLSGGGAVEKCVYGSLGSEKQTVKPLQLSVSAAVGAQLNVSQRIGLYVEPGVAYFFKDGSDVQTIRKEHPFNFNLQGGIRFTY
ncbi:MAG: PorT family protein [Bacteroidia bacterium]|nr:PorT family protein [Bacteroidia bacterium]